MVTLMEENILPFAKRSDAEEFRKKLRIPIIKGVFTKYNERLEHIFEKYARAFTCWKPGSSMFCLLVGDSCDVNIAGIAFRNENKV